MKSKTPFVVGIRDGYGLLGEVVAMEQGMERVPTIKRVDTKALKGAILHNVHYS
ncbi:MAG: hypothetical protein JKY48_01270 [Flavobacteriales bacterium]|nr:hypothetical protein [Flavobacteriales bacterium]